MDYLEVFKKGYLILKELEKSINTDDFSSISKYYDITRGDLTILLVFLRYYSQEENFIAEQKEIKKDKFGVFKSTAQRLNELINKHDKKEAQ